MPWTAGIIRGKLITTMINHIPSWLVVWLPCLAFSHINWELHHPNWLSYFSKGFKPPTRPYSLYILTKFYLSTILEAKKKRSKETKNPQRIFALPPGGKSTWISFFFAVKVPEGNLDNKLQLSSHFTRNWFVDIGGSVQNYGRQS